MKPAAVLLASFTVPACVSAWPSIAKDMDFVDMDFVLDARKLPKNREWQPVPPDGVRAPCPGTNTLANHGFVNRNGKNVTRRQYQQGFQDAFNIDFSVTAPGALHAMQLCGRTLGLGHPCHHEFTLDMLNKPHAIEHDASLSRNDKKMKDDLDADNSSFNETVWNRVMDVFGDATHIDMQLANTARLRRNEQSIAEDVEGWFKEKSSGVVKEHAFYLTAFHDPTSDEDRATNPQARKDWVHYWFVNERLPTELGWAKPTARIFASELDTMIVNIAAQPTIPASTKTSDPDDGSTTTTTADATPTDPPSSGTTTTDNSSEPTDPPSDTDDRRARSRRATKA